MRNWLFIIPLIVCGCSDIPGKLLIMEANSHSSRGMYNEAMAPYMKALEYTESEPYGEYGLGLIYFAVGENRAALDRLINAQILSETVSEPVNRELRYRIHYNTGVVLFSEGDFSGAASSFREALKINGSKVDAKRNLELSLKSLARENMSGGGNNTIEDESKAAFFGYIRQRELNRWRSREWPQEDESSEPDY
jgi:Ca-activated chloride channel family protein